MQFRSELTSPDPAKQPKHIFLHFCYILRDRDRVQGLLQALKFNFPSKMPDLDAYVQSYITFRRF